jgi:hypothetical protein
MNIKCKHLTHVTGLDIYVCDKTYEKCTDCKEAEEIEEETKE